MEQVVVSGVTYNKNEAKITVSEVAGQARHGLDDIHAPVRRRTSWST